MFADRLIAATRKYGPLCVGIDPHRVCPTLEKGFRLYGLVDVDHDHDHAIVHGRTTIGRKAAEETGHGVEARQAGNIDLGKIHCVLPVARSVASVPCFRRAGTGWRVAARGSN